MSKSGPVYYKHKAHNLFQCRGNNGKANNTFKCAFELSRNPYESLCSLTGCRYQNWTAFPVVMVTVLPLNSRHSAVEQTYKCGVTNASVEPLAIEGHVFLIVRLNHARVKGDALSLVC